MNVPALDLAYELQVEYSWDPEFALAAHDEYRRWLMLRIKANDFDHCKYPPSRVIAMVWSLHRLWTMDYAAVCNSLGGFLHHYPPAMRMNVTREQAYSGTIAMYKTLYKIDPPASYWGPSICTDTPMEQREPTTAVAIPSGLPVHPIQPVASLSTETPPRSSRGRAKKRASASPPAAISRPDDMGRTGRISMPGAPAVTGASPPSADRTPGRRRSSGAGTTRTSRVEKNHVLRPLAPGEKRRRGRPRQSDYVPVVDGAGSSTTPGPSGMVERGGPSPLEVVPGLGVSKPAGRGRGRGRRSSKSGDVGPAGERAASVTALLQGDNRPATVDAQGNIVLKRPRGRPRKDGSWPRPRSLQNSASKDASNMAPELNTGGPVGLMDGQLSSAVAQPIVPPEPNHNRMVAEMPGAGRTMSAHGMMNGLSKPEDSNMVPAEGL